MEKMDRRLICLFLSILVCLISCGPQDREEQLVEALVDLESTQYPGEEVPAGTLTRIREAVRLYNELVDAEIAATREVAQLYKQMAKHYLEIGAINRQIAALGLSGAGGDAEPSDADYHKLLALKSLDAELYGKAYTSLEQAIGIDSRNPILYYLAGVAAGWVGKSGLDAESEREVWLDRAEQHYRRAIALKPAYTDALYGLAVLLVFEYDGRLAEAREYVDQVLQQEPENIDALFLSAAIAAGGADYAAAVGIYQEILRLTGSESVRKRADELKAVVEEALYELE